MNIEDVEITDAADASFVIRKFFKDQFTGIKMSQLEQLVLMVYNMGKKSGNAAGSESPDAAPDANEPANPFKINNKARIVEDFEMGHSGEIIKQGTEGTVSSVHGDMVSFLFESGDEGEMFETAVPFEKLEKIE